MEITIDESIKELEQALANNTIEDVESAFKYISAIHMAIDTMRKHQKIKDIIEYGDAINLECEYVLDEIREVVNVDKS